MIGLGYIGFQSTLSRRERLAAALDALRAIAFQSTLSRRERQDLQFLKEAAERISIHALTKRATPSRSSTVNLRRNFNPRSHEESDKTLTALFIYWIEFQSTLSRRERRGAAYYTKHTKIFQSTLSRRERRDCKYGYTRNS